MIRERKPGSIGQPLPDIEVKTVDTDGTEVLVNEVGELIVRGPNISSIYYKLPDETAETFREGWLYTGDMARIDEDGYIFIVDRKKDLIIRGGLNILPRDVEEVKCFLLLQPGASVSDEEIISHCREYLAKYKCPKYVTRIDALPRSPIGKILKTELRKIVM